MRRGAAQPRRCLRRQDADAGARRQPTALHGRGPRPRGIFACLASCRGERGQAWLRTETHMQQPPPPLTPAPYACTCHPAGVWPAAHRHCAQAGRGAQPPLAPPRRGRLQVSSGAARSAGPAGRCEARGSTAPRGTCAACWQPWDSLRRPPRGTGLLQPLNPAPLPLLFARRPTAAAAAAAWWARGWWRLRLAPTAAAPCASRPPSAASWGSSRRRCAGGASCGAAGTQRRRICLALHGRPAATAAGAGRRRPHSHQGPFASGRPNPLPPSSRPPRAAWRRTPRRAASRPSGPSPAAWATR